MTGTTTTLRRFPLTRAAALLLTLAATLAPAAEPDVSEKIRSYLEGLDAGDVPMVAGRRLSQAPELARVYRLRDHAPLWLADAPLHREIASLLSAINDSVGHGFVAERYHRAAIEGLARAGDESSQFALELLLTDAFLSQALHRARGAVFPPNLDADWQVPQAEVDAGGLLLGTAERGGPVADALAALWPTAPEYALLLERRAEILAMGDEMTAQVAPGPLLKPGQSNDRIVMLKQRLMGPGDHSPLYDEDLRREVVAFQRAAGLEPDGIVGDNTLEMMNATRVSWIDRIDANLERWRWLPRDTPASHVRVNIAAFTLRAFEEGRPALAMNVIVGQPFRRTPVFAAPLRYLVLNPYWNVPYSIATKDKLPLLKADAAAEAGKGYEVKPHGSDQYIPVDAIDWSPVTPRTFNYLLRQRPGPQNALGRVKFMMPNAHAVYLHDTPSRELFARQERSFSSGCIRLERPLELAEWLLAREQHPAARRIEALLAAGDTITLSLKTPMPTYLVYFTAFGLDDETIVFRRDIYGRDRQLIEALRAQSS